MATDDRLCHYITNCNAFFFIGVDHREDEQADVGWIPLLDQYFRLVEIFFVKSDI